MEPKLVHRKPSTYIQNLERGVLGGQCSEEMPGGARSRANDLQRAKKGKILQFQKGGGPGPWNGDKRKLRGDNKA